MILVDMPKTRGELFLRLVVSFIASVMMGEAIFDYLQTFDALSFLNPSKRQHVAAVDFFVGGLGWFVLGGVAQVARKWRGDPLSAIGDAKKTLAP